MRASDGCLLVEGRHVADWAFTDEEIERIRREYQRLDDRRWERGNDPG